MMIRGIEVLVSDRLLSRLYRGLSLRAAARARIEHDVLDSVRRMTCPPLGLYTMQHSPLAHRASWVWVLYVLPCLERALFEVVEGAPEQTTTDGLLWGQIEFKGWQIRTDCSRMKQPEAVFDLERRRSRGDTEHWLDEVKDFGEVTHDRRVRRREYAEFVARSEAAIQRAYRAENLGGDGTTWIDAAVDFGHNALEIAGVDLRLRPAHGN